LLVLGDDRRQDVCDRLGTGEAGAAIALLVEVSKHWSVLVQEPPDPKSVDMNDDIAQMGQRFQRRLLSFPGRLTKSTRRHALHNAAYDCSRRPDSLEDGEMFRSHFAGSPV
jgi:hypothetical protein